MNLATRIEKLEEKIAPKEEKTYFIGWRDCEWRESEGLLRLENESIENFKNRVLEMTDKKFIWVK